MEESSKPENIASDKPPQNEEQTVDKEPVEEVPVKDKTPVKAETESTEKKGFFRKCLEKLKSI